MAWLRCKLVWQKKYHFCHTKRVAKIASPYLPQCPPHAGLPAGPPPPLLPARGLRTTTPAQHRRKSARSCACHLPRCGPLRAATPGPTPCTCDGSGGGVLASHRVSQTTATLQNTNRDTAKIATRAARQAGFWTKHVSGQHNPMTSATIAYLSPSASRLLVSAPGSPPRAASHKPRHRQNCDVTSLAAGVTIS